MGWILRNKNCNRYWKEKGTGRTSDIRQAHVYEGDHPLRASYNGIEFIQVTTVTDADYPKPKGWERYTCSGSGLGWRMKEVDFNEEYFLI